MDDNEEIKKYVKMSYGEPPDHLGSFMGININKDLDKDALCHVLWWMQNRIGVALRSDLAVVAFNYKNIAFGVCCLDSTFEKYPHGIIKNVFILNS